jgi:hypothetical protein
MPCNVAYSLHNAPMRGDNHSQREMELNSLAAQIREEISVSGICYLNKSDLELIWLRAGPLADEEKRMRVKDFAFRYEFAVLIDLGFSSAVFKNS